MQKITILLIGVLFIQLISSCANCTEAQQDQATVAHRATADTVDPLVFLAQLDSTKIFKGDFNGDGRIDTLFAAPARDIKGAQLQASIHTAWPYYGKQSTLPDLLHGGPIALVIAESYPDRPQYSIIYDPNPISILATQAAEGMFVVHTKDSRNPAWQDLNGVAKGDLLVIPTEAGIDSYLFWDGTGYRSLEVSEMP